MKHTVAVFASLLLVLGLLAGCTNTPSSAPSAAAASTAGTESAQPPASAVAPAAAAFKGKYIVDAQYVLDNIDREDVLLVDARGEEAAANGTLKGAIAVKWQMFADVANGKAGDAYWGNILPPNELSQALSATGISPDKEILLFSSAQKGWGEDGRIAWELLAAGFPNVKIINGSFEYLKDAGVPTVKGAAPYTPALVTVEAINEAHDINTDELVDRYGELKIVDVRTEKEYEGAVLYGEAAGGHLPGAVLVEFADLFSPDGTLKSNNELSDLFQAAGLEPSDAVVTYCTAGIRSAYMQLVMEMCGYDNVMNYDESFYRWCAVEDVEKG